MPLWSSPCRLLAPESYQPTSMTEPIPGPTGPQLLHLDLILLLGMTAPAQIPLGPAASFPRSSSCQTVGCRHCIMQCDSRPGWGASPAYQCPHSSWPCCNRTSLEHFNLLYRSYRGEHAAGPQRLVLHKTTSPSSGTYLMLRKKCRELGKMRRQRNTFQKKEQDEISENNTKQNGGHLGNSKRSKILIIGLPNGERQSLI